METQKNERRSYSNKTFHIRKYLPHLDLEVSESCFAVGEGRRYRETVPLKAAGGNQHQLSSRQLSWPMDNGHVCCKHLPTAFSASSVICRNDWATVHRNL